MEKMVGHVFNFLNAGLTTVTSTICFALFELARRPEIQTRLRAEIEETLKTKNAELLYNDSLNSKSLMNNVLKETLRMYPVIGAIKRVSRVKYKIVENLTIPDDMEVLIPCRAIHYDSQYFENPESFNPDRFLDSTSWMFMPFGKGPRQCLGMRFALMEMKLILSEVLTRFEIQPSTKMKLPITYRSRILLATNVPENDIWVKLQKLSERSDCC